jgi:hypothetical protein
MAHIPARRIDEQDLLSLTADREKSFSCPLQSRPERMVLGSTRHRYRGASLPSGDIE